MPDAMLVITGPGGQREVELKPKGKWGHSGFSAKNQNVPIYGMVQINRGQGNTSCGSPDARFECKHLQIQWLHNELGPGRPGKVLPSFEPCPIYANNGLGRGQERF